MLAFTIFYLIILVPFATISKNNLTLGILYQIVSFIFGLWMLMFGYAMFKNLKAISSAEINPQDVKNVKKFIKIGALGLVIGIIILVVGMAFAAVAIYKQFPNGLTGQNKSASFMQEQLKDSDGDGFRDVQEKVLGTDPYKKDTDGDGLSDYDEMYKWHTDPLKADTDMDGYKDGEEIASGYDPLGPGKLNAGSWIYDVCQGIGIYSVDISQSLQWEKTKTVCVSPQCNGGVLAADNNVDFSNYPARDACKTVGGRLPTKSEFICLYANYIPKQDREYWSSELYNDDGTSAQFFSYDNNFPDNYVGGGADVDAYMYIRCVKDNQNS
jgi:TRAP-type C4-dicarboxylate transport system permease small subunit